MSIHRKKWMSFIFEALKHQNCPKYNNYLWKQLCSSIFCTTRMLNTDECFLFIFGVVKHYRHVLNMTIIYEGNMLGCTYHVESIHSNVVISWNHWPALTVWGDKTNRISQNWSLFYHHTSPQDVHPRIRSTGQSARQQHTYHSARRGTVCGEWHLTLPLRKGYCSADQQDPTYQNWPTKTIPAARLLNSLPRRKHAMIVSHNINLIVPLIPCVIQLLNLVTQNMKNQSEISWQFPAHPPPQRLRNYNEQAKIISLQIAQARSSGQSNFV